MTDQQRDQGNGRPPGRDTGDQTVVLPSVKWPSSEPDRPAGASGHVDYLDTPDGPMQAPPDGVYNPGQGQAQGQHQDLTQQLRQHPQQYGQSFAGPAREYNPDDPATQLFGGDQLSGHPGHHGMSGHGGPPNAPGTPGTPGAPGGPAGPSGPRSGMNPMLRRGLLVAAGVFGLLVLVYGVDLLLARGEVPRGVTVAGVDVGGMGRAEAEQLLRDELGSRLTEPVAVRAGDVDATVDPVQAGLDLDWLGTLDQAGSQPLNPWTRLTSLFGGREVGVVSTTDDTRLTPAVEALKATVDHEPSEGAIRFDGITPVGVDPRAGQTLDVPAAVAALTSEWAAGGTVELPVNSTPVRSTVESVRAALDGIARPAVSGPVTITGEGGEATLTPELIAGAMAFEVGPDGALNPIFDTAKLTEALRPQLVETEKVGKDATIALQGGKPVVTPSVDGRGVDWAQSLAELPTVVRAADNRALTAVYTEQPAKFTTEQANALGIKEVVGEFTTRGFASDSGVNIRQIAAEVNGATVKPGETFSLNQHTGPRGAAQGYVEAGIIDKGRPGRAVGGGASQFTTTLFNASYFAGMTDVVHKEHSYYISRYPEAREATIFDGVIDLAFRNDSPSGILIETLWTPSSITVRIWSTKHYEVESVTGARSNFTSPNTVTIPHGEPCSPGSGAGGFSVSNTRIVKDARTGAEIKRNTRTAVYNPVPKVECAPAPAG